jgi:hypothetical protein
VSAVRGFLTEVDVIINCGIQRMSGKRHFGPGEDLTLPRLNTGAATAAYEERRAEQRRAVTAKSQYFNHAGTPKRVIARE